MTAAIERFYAFMEQYAAFIDEMAVAEDAKYQALLSNDVSRMDKAIADMQANMMRLDKLEAQRETLQKEAGFEGLIFKDIIARLEEDQKSAFMNLFEHISRAVALVQHSNQKSMSYADMSLYINDLMPDDSKDITYTADGEKTTKTDGDKAGSVFETKI